MTLGLLTALDRLDELIRKYNDDQPRDESGRWTSGGGGGSQGEVVGSAGVTVQGASSPAQREFVGRTLENVPASHLDGLSRVRYVSEQTLENEYGGARDERPMADYNSRTGEMRLLSNMEQLIRDEDLADNPREVVLHETGHHVHFSKLTIEAADEWRKMSMNGGMAHISSYARECAGEHFAEAYSLYFAGGKSRDRLASKEPYSFRFMASLEQANSPRLLPPGRKAPESQWGRRYGKTEPV